jgi:bacteriocin-like protein
MANEKNTELTEQELDHVSGGTDIGPVHIQAGNGFISVSVGGVGVWAGGGCAGVFSGNSSVSTCK